MTHKYSSCCRFVAVLSTIDSRQNQRQIGYFVAGFGDCRLVASVYIPGFTTLKRARAVATFGEVRDAAACVLRSAIIGAIMSLYLIRVSCVVL